MSLKICILCSDRRHPINPWLDRFQTELRDWHDVRIVSGASEVGDGDFLFLISCHEIIRTQIRRRFRHTLVIHASALPAGRGMSPHVWQVLEGKNFFAVSLLNAEDLVDSGDIWKQIEVQFGDDELFDEINGRLFDAETELMRWAIENCDRCTPRPQVGTPSYYRRREPADSQIDPRQSIAEQFNLLRIADPERYPAFFELHDQRYMITIKKLSSRETNETD